MSANCIDLRHLPPYVLSQEEETYPDRPVQPPSISPDARRPLSNGEPPPSSLVDSASSWTEIEKKKILAALLRNNGSRSLAARELGWGRSTLWRKIKQYKIE